MRIARPPLLLAEAQALIGKHCTADFMKPDPAFPGFVPAKGIVPVIGRGNLVVPRDKDGSRFAFLFETGEAGCKRRDVVSLPAVAPGDKFLSCQLDSWSIGAGFGYRRAGVKRVAGYWVVQPDRLVFERVPLAFSALAVRFAASSPNGANSRIVPRAAVCRDLHSGRPAFPLTGGAPAGRFRAAFRAGCRCAT